jgi:glycerate dehydrogenase
MHTVVLDADTLGRDLDLTVFDRFGTTTVHGYTTPDRIAERVREADFVITNKMRLGAGNLRSASHLRLICMTGTGTDGIDKVWCARNGIGVCNIRGYCTDSVVQHTFALLFTLLERTDRLWTHTRSGAYVGDTTFRHLDWTFHELSGQRFGILGMGAIGRGVAQAASAFGAEPVYWSSHDEDREGSYERLGLEELLRTSDVVSVHSPLNDRTRGLLSDKELGWMKSSAYLLNLGRGGIVDEAALARALAAGRLAGCGLDVLAMEPMAEDSPLRNVLGSDRLFVTPHVAWASIEARRRCIDEVVLNLEDFLAGGSRNRVESLER